MKTELHEGDCLEILRFIPDESINCIVTSPPYWGLRDYGHGGQIGLEQSFPEYLAKLIEVFEECRRVLRKDGTCWVNMGDSYSSGGGINTNGNRGNPHSRATRRRIRELPSKNLIGQPWRLAFALQDAGWILRSDIIWHKPNPMPESVTDRPTRAHEYVFLFVKSKKYYYNADAIREPLKASSAARLSQDVASQNGSLRANGGAKTNGAMKAVGGGRQSGHGQRHAGFNERYRITASQRFGGPNSGFRKKECPNNAQPSENPTVGQFDDFQGANARDVWTISPKGYKGAHFAVFPEALPEKCILAGCPAGGTVLDPFAGSGTTLAVAHRLGRNSVGIELNSEYISLARARIAQVQR